MVFVGPSGCGKTTTLRMIAGLETITSGEIRIDDKVVNDVAPRHRDIAMVFQNYALYPHYKVFDNIGYPLRRRRVPKAEIKQRVHEVAAHAGRRAPAGPLAAPAFRRRAAARGAGPRHHPQPERLPDGRAAEQPGRQAARPDAPRDHPPAARAGHDHDLRHPRPGGGDDDGGPHHGAPLRPHPADRAARATLQLPRQHVRRRLHRQPGDERRARPAGGERGRADARHPQRPAPAAAADRRPPARRWRRRGRPARGDVGHPRRGHPAGPGARGWRRWLRHARHGRPGRRPGIGCLRQPRAQRR